MVRYRECIYYCKCELFTEGRQQQQQTIALWSNCQQTTEKQSQKKKNKTVINDIWNK